MIKVEEVLELLKQLPKDARLQAYEGEGIGLIVKSADGKQSGWIETGIWDRDSVKPSEHDLAEFKQ